MVTLGILGTMLAISVPWFVQMQRQSRLNSVAQAFMGKVHEARNQARTGVLLEASGVGPTVAGEFDGWAAAKKSTTAGLRITGASSYELFADDDNVAGGELVISTIDLTAQHSDNQVVFVGLVGQEIRFKKDGSAVNSVSITVMDETLGEAREIEVSKVGQIRITPKKL